MTQNFSSLFVFLVTLSEFYFDYLYYFLFPNLHTMRSSLVFFWVLSSFLLRALHGQILTHLHRYLLPCPSFDCQTCIFKFSVDCSTSKPQCKPEISMLQSYPLSIEGVSASDLLFLIMAPSFTLSVVSQSLIFLVIWVFFLSTLYSQLNSSHSCPLAPIPKDTVLLMAFTTFHQWFE